MHVEVSVGNDGKDGGDDEEGYVETHEDDLSIARAEGVEDVLSPVLVLIVNIHSFIVLLFDL